MKTINATLLAAQKLPAGRPFARASLADNSRLHPTHQGHDAYTGGLTQGVSCDTFYIRIRFKGSGVQTLEYQKITDPTIDSQWTTWNSLVSDVRDGAATGLFWTGTYVVVVWQDLSDSILYYRRSSDGSTWSSATSILNPAGNDVGLSGVSGGVSQSGIVLNYINKLYWQPYNPSTDLWGIAEDAGITIDTSSGAIQCAGLYDSTNTRHVFALAPINYYFAWTRFALLLLTRTGVSTFTTPRPYYISNPTNLKHMSFSQSKINGFWWLSFSRARAYGQDPFWLAPSNDGVFFEDAYPMQQDADPLMSVLPPLTGRTDAWIGNESDWYNSDAQSYWSNVTVVRYSLSPEGELVAHVDNRSGALTGTVPQLHSIFTLSRGYEIEGTEYPVSLGTFYVTGYRYLARDQLLELRAHDARGLLRSWAPDQDFAFKSETIQTLVELICALAGVHTVSFDSDPLWSITVADFAILAGTSGLSALENLRRLGPFEWYSQEDGSLKFVFAPAATTVQHTYGTGGHQFWPGEFGTQPNRNYVLVLGDPANTASSHQFNFTDIAAQGRRSSLVIVEPRRTSEANADATATDHIQLQNELARYGEANSPPNFALEPLDVVEVVDATYPPAAGDWRVTGFAEFYNTRQAGIFTTQNDNMTFYQRVCLRGV